MKSPVWIATAGITAGVLSVLIAHAAQDTPVQPHLNVKMGLWQMTAKPQVSGDMAGMAEQQMQNMTPEQRAKMQQAMQAAMAAMQQPRVTKECMTAEKMARGFRGGEDGGSCKTTVVTNSSTDLETREQCGATDAGESGDVHLTALANDHIVGVVHGDMSRNGRKMTYDMKLEGKWLSSDCGNIKDSEVVSGPK